MNDNFMTLLKQLDLDDKADVYQGDLVEILVNEANNSWLFDISLDEVLSIDDFETFNEKIESLPKKFTHCS